MKIHRFARFFAPALALVLTTALVGCESNLSSPLAELSLETKNAAEVLPADARMVGMVNVAEVQRNDLVREHMNPMQRLTGDDATRLQAFIDATGFNPEKDFREAYVAVSPEDDVASIVVYADYDRDRLKAYVDQEMPHPIEATDYKGTPVYRSDDMAFALANDNMMLASNREDNLHAMIDRLEGTGRALKDDARMMSLIEQVAGSTGWMVARELDLDPPVSGKAGRELREITQVGRAVQDVAASFTVTSVGMDGYGVMMPKSDVSSDDVAALMRGLLAAMKAQPELNKDALDVLDDVRIQSRGDRVDVRFRIDNATLQSF